MPTYSSYQNTLPDPTNFIADSGAATGAVGGAGFKSVKLSSKTKTMKNRTNGGRLITRSFAFHQWDINITYNPMTRDEFEPVYNFLLQKNGGLKPFYVSLPQYKKPRDSKFETFCTSFKPTVINAHRAGKGHIRINGTSMTGTISGHPRPGDLFTIIDPNNAGHTKAYMVTRVETNEDHASGEFAFATGPSSDDERTIHITPPLSKDVSNDSELEFINPKIRVILARDVQDYSLGVNNLYSFSLRLEEIQP